MPHAHKNLTRQEYSSARLRRYPQAGAFTKHRTHKFERRNTQDIQLGIEEVLAERTENVFYSVPETDQPGNPAVMWLDYEFNKAWEQGLATLHDTYEDASTPMFTDFWQARDDIDAAIVDAFKARLARKHPRCKHLTR